MIKADRYRSSRSNRKSTDESNCFSFYRGYRVHGPAAADRIGARHGRSRPRRHVDAFAWVQLDDPTRTASLHADPAGLLPTFRHLAGLAPQAIYLAEDDLSAQLLEAGYRSVEVLRVRKRAAMSRCVHVARADL